MYKYNKYDYNKSFSLCFKRKELNVSSPSFFLGKSKIPMVEQCRYLRTTISIENSDLDLKRQMRKMYANVLWESFLNARSMSSVTYLQWCSGNFSLVGTLTWHYGHRHYHYWGGGGGASMNGHFSRAKIYVQTGGCNFLANGVVL